MTSEPAVHVSIVLLALAVAFPCVAADERLAIDLHAPDAAGQWVLLDDTAEIQRGVLVLDGRSAASRAVLEPLAWDDVTLQANFMVEPAAKGVLACGFMVRVADATTYYYVHYDRAQAILVRSDASESWNEIRRASGLDKPAGRWHEGRLECDGDRLRVHLNGKLLYEARDATLRGGRVGFYAGQGRAHVKDIVVTGKRRAPSKPFSVPRRPEKFVLVCRDAGAGGYEAFPDVCRLADGRLMCVFYAGYAHVSRPGDRLPRGGRVAYCLSADEGRSWSEARVLHDGPDDDRDPSITQLSNGRLLCTFFNRGGAFVLSSRDAGETWSEPVLLGDRHAVSSPVRELSDGRLILGLYHERGGVANGAVVMSDDGGETWGDVVDIDNGGHYLDAETDVVELAGGELFAAMRGRERMWWSRSSDGGRTWSLPVSFGTPGHCPYLHRAVDGTILLGHRLPATSLRFSRDECRTWSDDVRVDDHGGAYPSMVNLRDGSVLIVYYEEGAGSNIRARRFRTTPSGIEWLPPADDSLADLPARLIDVRRIWDRAPHNAFTDLVRFRDRWFCVFREGQGHVSPDGALRVIVSADGRSWRSAALLSSDDSDLRDAKISVTPDGRLMLSGAAALHQPEPIRHQSLAWFSDDGETWSEPVKVGDPNLWLWRVSWRGDTGYGIGYSTVADKFIRLYRTVDGGRTYERLVGDLGVEGYPNETSIIFGDDGAALCLLRRDPAEGMLGASRPPYTEWRWRGVGTRIGGPDMIALPDGRLVAVVRLYDGGARTSVCSIDADSGKLTELFRLPSGGDTSYAGLVWHERLLWVSYYASHEGKTSIYLARVRFD